MFDRDRDRSRPPRLLVSVRSSREARAAVQGGADVVDAKEPARGPLGMPDAATIAEIVTVCRAMRRGVATSAALGELAEWTAARPRPRFAMRPRFLKLGLAGSGVDWRTRWAAVREQFGDGFEWVAVAYADWRAAAAPEPAAVVEHAVASRCSAVLFDTFDKRGGSLLHHLPAGELAAHVRATRSAGLAVALAGKLDRASLPAVLELEPDVVAIRSAACRGGNRGATVDADAVREFRGTLHGRVGAA